MRIFEKIADIQSFVLQQRELGKTIGFVPTMGALHIGHISLVKQSVAENDITAVSIFVNPIQFNNPLDLEKYPRDLKSDQEMLEAAGVDVIFVPSVEEMYPKPVTLTYEFGSLSTVMEGEFRPGHFNGVAVVVHKLFEIVMPHRAYFGEKDFQQLQIIKSLVQNLQLPVQIVPCPISREDDGLARSSRNARLTPEMREAAPFIHAQLLKARDYASSMTSEQLEKWMMESFNNHQLLKLEYFTVADGETLQHIQGKIPVNSYGFIAVYAGDIRLIDNIRLI